MPDVTLITPTGDRPGSFALLERWVARQTYQGSVQWIVVDDGNRPTVCTRGQEYVRRNRGVGEPRHTLSLNLVEGLRRVKAPLVVVAEDDEWWGPEYLARMVWRLSVADLVGEQHSRNWCMGRRAWTERNDSTHASLCRTAWTARVTPFALEACTTGTAAVDLILWRHGEHSRKMFWADDPQEVSIKNVPGRRRTLRFRPQTADPDAVKLVEWIGAEDAAAYLMLAGGNTTTQIGADEMQTRLPDTPPGRLLFTFPGKFGDIFWQLPVLRAVQRLGYDVSLATMPRYNAAHPLLESQGIAALAVAGWNQTDDRCGARPALPPDVPPGYDAAISLAYGGQPDCPLAEHGFRKLGLPVPDRLTPFIDLGPVSQRRDRVAFAFNPTDMETKAVVLRRLQDRLSGVVWVNVVDMPFLEAAIVIAESRFFLGCRSACWVLAAGLGKRCLIVEPVVARRHPRFGCPNVEEMMPEPGDLETFLATAERWMG